MRDPDEVPEHHLVGGAVACTITVIDKDEWPSKGAAKAGALAIYLTYVKKVLSANVRNESVWFIGLCYRAVRASQSATTPLLCDRSAQ